LMDPALHMKARAMARESVSNLLDTISNPRICDGLRDAGDMLDGDRPFDALKKVRSLLPLEVAANVSEERSREVA
ncbi:MAG TPA: flagellar biosynthesis repressor FlbT, partial [Hyphomicrobium sp.]|nr:flagellar biosynthesis repressor FlbT [Hyphomicrobium sp.]